MTDVQPEIAAMRSVKDADEINVTTRAVGLVCTAIRQTAQSALAGKSELQVEAAGTEATKDEAQHAYPASVGASGLSMCASGVERALMPHTLTGPRRIEEGDVLLNTRQFALDGYYADCQRTFFVGGSRSSDTVLITEDGCRVLTDSCPRGLDELARR